MLTRIRFMLILLVLVFPIILTTTDCGKREPDVIKVGAILPLTGDLAFLGEPGKNALTIAQEQINQRNGIKGMKLEISFYDSKADPKTGLTEFNRALSVDKIDKFITTLTGVSLAIKPVAQTSKALQMIIAIFPNIVEGSDHAMRVCYNAQQEAQMILDLVQNSGLKTVGILKSRDAATENEVNEILIPQLKAKGVNPLVESFDVGQKDFKSLAVNVSRWKVSDIVLLGYGSDFLGILKDLNSLGVLKRVRIIGGIGFLEIPKETPKELLGKVIFVTPRFNALQTDTGFVETPFVSEYRKRFSSSYVPYDAGYTYDSIMLLAEVMNTAEDLTPETIRSKMIQKGTFQGITGPIKILPNGDTEVDVTWATFQNGIIRLATQ